MKTSQHMKNKDEIDLKYVHNLNYRDNLNIAGLHMVLDIFSFAVFFELIQRKILKIKKFDKGHKCT